MDSAAVISNTEVFSIHDGIVNDVREDGRTLLQRRRPQIRIFYSGGGGGAAGEEAEAAAAAPAGNSSGANSGGTVQPPLYDGSRAEVRLGGTTVLAAATPSVVEGAAGELHVRLDAAPGVAAHYAHALGGSRAQYRRAFLSALAASVQAALGAAVTPARDSDGVAEAELSSGEDDNEEGDERDGQDGEGEGGAAAAAGGCACGFPAADLAIGGGYAFRLDVDVHVLEAGGGAAAAAVVLAVHAALRAARLPAVQLHEGAAAGVTVEEDRTRPYARRVDWGLVPAAALLLLSPTRHYLADPTAREELALPLRLLVSADREGRLQCARLQQWPSRRGAHYGAGGGSEDGAEALRPPEELHASDWLAAVAEGVHLCQATVADCDAALAAAGV